MAQEIAGGFWVRFLGFATVNLLDHLGDALIGQTQAGDAGIVLLEQAEQGHILQTRGKTKLHQRFWLVFLGRIKLRETRTQKMRLPEVALRGDFFLFDVIVHKPDFGTVVFGSVSDQNDFEQWLVELQVDAMVKLRDQRAKPLEKGDADLFEVLLGAAGLGVKRIGSGHGGEFTVEADGSGLRGDLPLGRAKQNADVAAVHCSDTRRNGLRLERMVDRGEQDGSVSDVNNGAAASKVGNDFVFLRERERRRSKCGDQQDNGSKQGFHNGRVAQWLGCGPSSRLSSS